MSTVVNSDMIQTINEKEKSITQKDDPVAGGPTAAAQKHAGERLDGSVISDIAQGERKISGENLSKGGPTATAQSVVTKSNAAAAGKEVNRGTPVCPCCSARGCPCLNGEDVSSSNKQELGYLTTNLISKILDAEKKITHKQDPVADGPTAQAQKHAGEHLNSENMHDITEGEKNITGGIRVVKRGPTALVQSEMSRLRQPSNQGAGQSNGDDKNDNI